jgi:hypothetical protein
LFNNKEYSYQSEKRTAYLIDCDAPEYNYKVHFAADY